MTQVFWVERHESKGEPDGSFNKSRAYSHICYAGVLEGILSQETHQSYLAFFSI